MLEVAIADVAAPRPRFEFDRFDVTIERADEVVVLEDVLDATEAGAQTAPLPAFLHALRRSPA